MNRTNLTSLDFLDVISDEAETLRDMMDGYFNIETGQVENFERAIGHFVGSRRNRWLRTLHSPFTELKIKFADDNERHFVLSKIFGRTILSADEVTNIEAWAWSRCVGKYNAQFALTMLKELCSVQPQSAR